ncbi:MAG: recombination protein O N-terminal domain-containing protein [Verrucomicrobiales bacterium]
MPAAVEKARAILVGKSRLTETSLIVTWCTQEFGIVRTAAKGAMRPGGPFAGKLDLFFGGEITFARARRGDLHSLREVGVASHRVGISSSYLRVLAGSYFARLVEIVAEPEAPIEPLYGLLERALNFLGDKEPDARAVEYFEAEVAKFLGIAGEQNAADAIHDVYKRLPPQRGELFAKIARMAQRGDAPADGARQS